MYLLGNVYVVHTCKKVSFSPAHLYFETQIQLSLNYLNHCEPRAIIGDRPKTPLLFQYREQNVADVAALAAES